MIVACLWTCIRWRVVCKPLLSSSLSLVKPHSCRCFWASFCGTDFAFVVPGRSCLTFPGTPTLRRHLASGDLLPSASKKRPCHPCHGLRYRASMPCVRRPSDAMHHGSFFARSPRVLLRSAHPSLHLGRLTARRLRSLRSLRSDEHDALVPRFHAMFIRLARPIASSALPCHRRVSGAGHP